MKTTLDALSALLTKLSLVLVAIASTQAVYPITPLQQPMDVVDSISSQANILYQEQGIRPTYSGHIYPYNAILSPFEAELVSPYLLTCESQNTAVGCVLDSNNKYSCGPAQFQDWEWWESISGIHGDVNNESSSIRMMLWALENGYIARWSCAKIEHIIE